MIFFIQENFPADAGELLRAFDKGNEFEVLPYPQGTPEHEWVPQAGKRAPKPFILTLSDGMLRNKVSRQILRQSGCHYIYFSRAWERSPWEMLAWKLIKAWPNIVAVAASANRQSVIEVAISGRITIDAL